MITLPEKTKILNLLDAGFSVQEIVKKIGRSYGTIYKFKRAHHEKDSPVPARATISTKLSPFKTFIDHEIKKGVTNNTKIYREIKNLGYTGSYVLLNNYVKTGISKVEKYKRSKHVETPPGEQAQVDWGSFGKIEIGNRVERLYAFVYVLSYSRVLYVEFVVRQNQQTFQNCHMNAFEKLGIPKIIRYDNVKTVVLGREKTNDGSKRIRYNPAFLDFANYYGFKPEACPPYWPRSKGKVEASVKYLRHNFMAGEKFNKTYHTLQGLNQKVSRWLNNTAQERIHRTTHEKPKNLWLREREFLSFPGKLPRYNISPFCERRSTKDGLIHYKGNLYSVPSSFAHKKLYVRETTEHGVISLEIYYKDILAAKHPLSFERGKWVIDGQHELEERKEVSQKQNKPPKNKKWNIVVATRDLRIYNNLIPTR